MQTFLPYANFDKTAQVLDNKRLGNQVYREGKTLIGGGWPNHPASKMWRGYESALAEYCLALLRELRDARGRYYPRWFDHFNNMKKVHGEVVMPPWMGRYDIHSSHRANLLRKDPEWYGRFGWTETPAEGYVWPVR